MNEQYDKSEQKHTSRLGVASLVIGVVTPFLLVLFLFLSILLGSKKGTVGSAFAMVFLIIGLLAPFLHLTGFILGLCGWISKKTQNLFPIAGTILNAFLGVCGILIIYLLITNLTYGFR